MKEDKREEEMEFSETLIEFNGQIAGEKPKETQNALLEGGGKGKAKVARTAEGSKRGKEGSHHKSSAWWNGFKTQTHNA